jgi:chromosome segregation ATPase
VARSAYPPYDFVCPYQDCCPHLDGMSTTWVLEEYRRAEDSYQEHLQIIDDLDETLETARKRIRELEKEVAELRAKYQAEPKEEYRLRRQSL